MFECLVIRSDTIGRGGLVEVNVASLEEVCHGGDGLSGLIFV